MNKKPPLNMIMAIFLKTNKVKKGVEFFFIYPATPVKAYQIFVRLSL
jgi:hypothetical protein